MCFGIEQVRGESVLTVRMLRETTAWERSKMEMDLKIAESKKVRLSERVGTFFKGS